jgi:hypothetical protein
MAITPKNRGGPFAEAGMEGFPKFPVRSLADENLLDGFLQTLNWIVDQIRTA